MNFWFSRNIKSATRIQNLHPKDCTNKRITCDRQTIMGSLRSIRLCLFKKVRLASNGGSIFFFNCGSYKNLSLIHEINWISLSMVLWCFVYIAGFLIMNILVSVNNWYLLTLLAAYYLSDAWFFNVFHIYAVDKYEARIWCMFCLLHHIFNVTLMRSVTCSTDSG